MPPRNPSPSSHARILLVDDNAHGLAARKNVLEELGHHTVTASSGVDALEHLATHRFNLVITDYKMPRMDGLELIVRLRKQTPDLPVILISGFVDALGLNEQNTGADIVIQKSANEVTHLVRAVARLLSRKPVRKPAATERRTVKVKKKSTSG
jgi:CheY-like chemotaxis protein